MNIVQALEAFNKGQKVEVLLPTTGRWINLADCTLSIAEIASMPPDSYQFRLTPKYSITIGKNVIETNDLYDIESLENLDVYYMPSLTTASKFEIFQWNPSNELCRRHLSTGLVFKTREAAILATECLLDAVHLEIYNA